MDSKHQGVDVTDSPQNSELETINRILVIGGGWVGRQLAARFIKFGFEVWLCDAKPLVAQEAVAWIGAEEPRTSDQNLHLVNQLSDVAKLSKPIQLAIENVPEQPSLKKRVLREISSLLPPPTIICSNTSYFLPSALARFVTGPERFAHFHFHVPVTRQSVSDIVGCEATKPEVIRTLIEVANRIEQPPLLLRHEHPGYVFNWLLQSLLRSALELAARDVVDPAEIDRSWKAVTGMPIGPFGMMDQIGLDVIEQVLSNARWADAQPTDFQKLIDVLQEPICQGHLGVKTGRGFYEY